MPLQNLNRILILAHDLEATRHFYVNVLGLTIGPRPPFKFPGYWLYLGDKAVLHLAEQGIDRENAGTGPIDHVAFEATGLREMVSHLEERGIAVRHRKVPDLELHQVFIQDPSGVKIELNYPAGEGAEFEV